MREKRNRSEGRDRPRYTRWLKTTRVRTLGVKVAYNEPEWWGRRDDLLRFARRWGAFRAVETGQVVRLEGFLFFALPLPRSSLTRSSLLLFFSKLIFALVMHVS